MAKPFESGKFNINKKEDIYEGSNSTIDAVTLSSPSGKHPVNLLRKKFTGPYSIEFMQGPEWHTYLKAKGYPVLPTWRYDADNNIEYITDLRQGGTHRVIDFCGKQDNFAKVNISNMDEMKREVRKLLEKSANDGLIINPPNIFFDVEVSTGIAKIVLGDLRELGLDRFDNREVYPTREEIFIHNQTILEEHITELEKILE
jgi:hypothetical protein